MARDISMPLALDEIEIPEGRRVVNAAAVKRIAESVSEVGLRHPITVRRGRGDKYILVAGRHRLEAFRKLDKDAIPAIISSFSKLQAELWEIDENLCRSDLTPAEEAAAVARRKAIYEELYPKTKHGGDRKSEDAKSSGQDGHLNVERFTRETADASGKSERSVRRAASRGEDIGPDALDSIAGTSLDSGAELDALAKMSEPDRAVLIGRAVAGEDVSARPAKAAPEHPVNPICEAWRSASNTERREFLDLFADDFHHYAMEAAE